MLKSNAVKSDYGCHDQFLCAIAECFARLSYGPSVCLSVTLKLYCAKTVQARITKSLMWAATRTLVYRDKILFSCVRGFPLNEGVKEGYPLKNVILPLLARLT